MLSFKEFILIEIYTSEDSTHIYNNISIPKLRALCKQSEYGDIKFGIKHNDGSLHALDSDGFHEDFMGKGNDYTAGYLYHDKFEGTFTAKPSFHHKLMHPKIDQMARNGIIIAKNGSHEWGKDAGGYVEESLDESYRQEEIHWNVGINKLKSLAADSTGHAARFVYRERRLDGCDAMHHQHQELNNSMGQGELEGFINHDPKTNTHYYDAYYGKSGRVMRDESHPLLQRFKKAGIKRFRGTDPETKEFVKEELVPQVYHNVSARTLMNLSKQHETTRFVIDYKNKVHAADAHYFTHNKIAKNIFDLGKGTEGDGTISYDIPKLHAEFDCICNTKES